MTDRTRIRPIFKHGPINPIERAETLTRCTDLRTGLPSKRGQAGAAAALATIRRTDRVIRRDMAEAARRAS